MATPWNPMAIAGLGMMSPAPMGGPFPTQASLEGGVDRLFGQPPSEEINALAASLAQQGRQQAAPFANQGKFMGTGYSTGGPTDASLDALGAAQGRKDQQARSIMQPAVPQPGAMGAGARAQFYGGGQQPGQTDQEGMGQARGMMAGLTNGQPFAELNIDNQGRSMSTPEGSAAVRAMSMRGSPLYQKMIEARRAANAASVPGAAPQDSALPPVMMGTGSRPSPMQISDEQQSQIASRQAGRDAKAEEAQGLITARARNKGAARLARTQGINPQMTSPLQEAAMAQEQAMGNIAGNAAVDAARYGQQGEGAFRMNALGEMYNKIDQTTPQGKKQAMELAEIMKNGPRAGTPTTAPAGRIAPPQAGAAPTPFAGSTSDKFREAADHLRPFGTNIPAEVRAEAEAIYGPEAVGRAIDQSYNGGWLGWMNPMLDAMIPKPAKKTINPGALKTAQAQQEARLRGGQQAPKEEAGEEEKPRPKRGTRGKGF